MKRRTFLKTSALAAGASLLQSCAEDEQYLVQPLERQPGRPGVSRWLNSVCGQCQAGCGTRIRIVDGDARKIEGQPDHPINHGGLCALGQAGLQDHYNPDRVRTPLTRSGSRGSAGPLEELAWHDGLAQAARAIAAASPESLYVVSGGRSAYVDALLARLTQALGAAPPAIGQVPGAETERAALARILGPGRALPAYDIAAADYVLSIGPAFLDRGHQPVQGTWAMAQVRSATAGRRGKLVQAEARMSQTAAFADEWLPIRPGTEGVLARAIAGALAEGGLLREGSQAALYSQLFPAAAPSIEEAAATCDVPAPTIARLAAELGRADRPLVLAGGSAALTRNGEFSTLAALAINLLLAGFDREGGVSVSEPAAGYDFRDLGEIEAGARSGGTYVVVEADPVHTRPEGRGWREALSAAESVIVLGSFIDETALYADVLLPLHSDIERFGAVEASGIARPTVSLARSAVAPLYDTRHPGEIVLALGAALDQRDALPWDSFDAAAQAAFDARYDDGTGGAWSQALDGGAFQAERAEAVLPEKLAAFDGPEPPASTADGELTLVLFESAKYGDGRGANKPWLQELPDTMTTFMWSSWAEISVADSQTQGIRTGDLVEIRSAQGKITVPAAVRPGARPGTVAVPLGGGYTDYGRYAAERGENPLALVGAETVAGTTAAALVGTGVSLRRVGPGDPAIYGRGLRDAEQIPTGWASMAKGGDH
ncbi:MAG: molybdopterin-dependent oxidoreductase [Acidobacteriota bacterium]|nr:molybdopterin-dependent oxidoreductase [Acidobacteriota bacterium]